jgi:hypothetical protein
MNNLKTAVLMAGLIGLLMAAGQGAEIPGRLQPLAKALKRLDYLAHRIPMQVAPAAAGVRR